MATKEMNLYQIKNHQGKTFNVTAQNLDDAYQEFKHEIESVKWLGPIVLVKPCHKEEGFLSFEDKFYRDISMAKVIGQGFTYDTPILEDYPKKHYDTGREIWIHGIDADSEDIRLLAPAIKKLVQLHRSGGNQETRKYESGEEMTFLDVTIKFKSKTPQHNTITMLAKLEMNDEAINIGVQYVNEEPCNNTGCSEKKG